jgi:hypothetical protein
MRQQAVSILRNRGGGLRRTTLLFGALSLNQNFNY